jgi:signal recognition particle subunit SRP54
MGKGLDLEDFLGQMKKMKSMGSMKDIMKMIPGMGQQVNDMSMDDSELTRFEAIINSMTPRERKNPEVIEASRRRRIAQGSGTDPKDVSGLLKSFGQVRQMMKSMSGMSAGQRMQSLGQVTKMAGAGMMPKFKGSTSATKKRKPTRKEKRKKRKKHRR